jgi:hypothetical protein
VVFRPYVGLSRVVSLCRVAVRPPAWGNLAGIENFGLPANPFVEICMAHDRLTR